MKLIILSVELCINPELIVNFISLVKLKTLKSNQINLRISFIKFYSC